MSPKAAVDLACAYARGNHHHYLSELSELLSIPSISTDPDHAADVEKAAVWVEAHLSRIGLHGVRQLATRGHPIIYAEWRGAGPEAPTVLLYGHYDVQPADPLEEWTSPPFVPTQRGNDLFARGTSDDKAQFFAMLAAAEAYLKTSGKLPVNLKVLLEGEEEISSPHISDCLRVHQDLLKADAVLICDQPMLSPDLPTILYGVRGGVYMELEVRGPKVDFHSGTAGGGIANPLNVLVSLLASMTDESGRIAVEGFYDRVRPLTDDERKLLAKSPVNDAMIKQVTGVPEVAGEPGYTAAESLSVRPTLELHGIVGGYTGAGKKSVIPAKVTAKFSCRLVPDQDPIEIAEMIRAHVLARVPRTVTAELKQVAHSYPSVLSLGTPALIAAERAYQQAFKADPVYLRGGGSLPIVRDFIDVLHAPVVLIGFGLPDDNVHAPNEKIHLPNLWRGIETVIHYFAEFAASAGKKNEEI